MTTIGLSILPARADSPQCNAPPYGGTMNEYYAFSKNFGQFLDSTDAYLTKICRLKFEGIDRAPLYKLGLTDEDVNSQDTVNLGVHTIMTTKKLLDQTQ